ncbi:hypothetical protein [Microbispora sp. H10836]|uniref:hypothetical protein n=1 Tax=Microbispora sp. H10836 TaxID=2729106 RepID=UPI00147363D4|nr:hypothetical protein [Microbispora sp. H10836]
MPDYSPTPRHRRDGHPVLALTGVIGVTAIAGLGVVLAVLSGQDPAPPGARPVAAGLRSPVTPARTAPGFPAAGPFFSPPAAPPGRPETEPERAAEHREETADDVPERERPAGDRDAPPPGHESRRPRPPGRHLRATDPSSRSRPPSPDSAGTAGRGGTKEAERPRPARIAAPDATKAAVRGSATGNTAAKGGVPKDTAARDAGARDTAQPFAEADGAAQTQIDDPCLRFDDLRRDYCYEVLRRLS